MHVKCAKIPNLDLESDQKHLSSASSNVNREINYNRLSTGKHNGKSISNSYVLMRNPQLSLLGE